MVEHEDGVDRRPTPYEGLAWRQTQAAIAAELERLPDNEGAVIRQHYHTGLSFAHIADLLRLTRAACRNSTRAPSNGFGGGSGITRDFDMTLCDDTRLQELMTAIAADNGTKSRWSIALWRTSPTIRDSISCAARCCRNRPADRGAIGAQGGGRARARFSRSRDSSSASSS